MRAIPVPWRSGLLCASVVLTACSKAPTAQPAASPSPRAGGMLRMALTEPTGLDPALCEDQYQGLLIGQIFGGLVDADPDLNVRPDIARTWTVSRDGLTYDFLLRDDARFHNGRPVVAADVAYSLFRAGQLPAGQARGYVAQIRGGREAAEGRASSIDGIEVQGPQHLVIHLLHPYAPFLATLALPQFRIVPREVVEGHSAEFARQPIGSGPFRIVRWERGSRISLAAHDGYQGGRPYLDGVEIRFGEWSGQAVDHFLRGELDAALLGRDDEKRLPTGTPRFQRLELGVTCLGLNVGLPPLKDPRIRAAIALSVDRQAVVDASRLLAVATRAIVPGGMPGGTPTGLAPERNLAEARRLLAEAGHPEGQGLAPIDFWANRDRPQIRDAAAIVARNLAEVGIKVREHRAPWAKLLQILDSKQAPLYMLTWVADTPDRDSYLGLLFHSKGANNLLHYSDPEVDRLIEDARIEMDPEARRQLYRKVEERVGAANVFIPLFSEANCFALRRGLRGFRLDSFGQTDLRDVWWEGVTPGPRPQAQ